ncbi:DUF805 domain-containing protein [Caballeronia sp. M23-90]
MDMVFCHGCAKELHKSAPSCPGCGAPQAAHSPHAGSTTQRSENWYLEPLKKYATFSGRARRKEYWYFVLFSTIITVVLAIVSSLMDIKDVLNGLYNLAVLLPTIAVGVRRMHDTGRSGWWILLPIVNIIFLAQDGQSGDNKYGPDPKKTA